MSEGDVIRLIHEYGPFWGPLLGFAALLYLAIRYQWSQNGLRGVKLVANWLVLVVFVVGGFSLTAWYYYRYRCWGLPEPFSKDEIGILIGEVSGDVDRQQQTAYAQAIRELVQQSPELKQIVKIHLIERPLVKDPEQQQGEAIRIARWLHAAFVLRPFTVEGVQRPWLTVVDQAEFSTSEAPEGKFRNLQFADLDGLPLPADLVLLARCTLAFSYYRGELYRDAAKELQPVLASPKLPEAGPSRQGLDLTLGNALSGIGDHTGAIEAYQRAIELNPKFAFAHSNLANALRSIGRDDDAIREFRLAIELSPQFGVAHSNLAAALLSRGQYDAAIAEIKTALAIEPNLVAAHINLCAALAIARRYTEATEECDLAKHLKPREPLS